MAFTTFFKFLITYEFYSRLGFLISFTVTSLLVLELLRLVYTDANKREVEKLLDSYSKTRNETRPAERRRRIPIDQLEKPRFTTPPPHQRRTSSPAVTPDSERTLVSEEQRRRRHARAQSMAAAGLPTPITVTVTQGQAQQSQHHHSTSQAHIQTPPRRLRKRAETFNSSSSGESSSSRKLERRRRDASPASSRASSKASSSSSVTSHSSGSPIAKPMRKIREKDAHHHAMNSSSLQKLLKSRG